MVIEGTEQELRTTKAEDQAVPNDLTIEQITPRIRRGAWPQPGPGVGPEGPEERQERLLGSLGYLTLLTQPLNSALSNGPCVSERNALGEHGTLFLNKDLLEHSGDYAWDEEAIHARATRLDRAFVSAWPHFAELPTARHAVAERGEWRSFRHERVRRASRSRNWTLQESV